MTATIRTVVVATVLALAVSAGVALGSPAATTTTDAQANETASVSFSNQQTDGESVTIDSATLPDGGFAVVYSEGGERLGHTERLSAGDHENLTVSLNRSIESAQVLVVTLYRSNGTETYDPDEAVAYEDDGAEVSEVAYVYFEEPTRGDTAETEATTAEADSADGADETTDAETSADDGGTPGFTPTTAAVALLAAALVGLRRR